MQNSNDKHRGRSEAGIKATIMRVVLICILGLSLLFSFLAFNYFSDPFWQRHQSYSNPDDMIKNASVGESYTLYPGNNYPGGNWQCQNTNSTTIEATCTWVSTQNTDVQVVINFPKDKRLSLDWAIFQSYALNIKVLSRQNNILITELEGFYERTTI